MGNRLANSNEQCDLRDDVCFLSLARGTSSQGREEDGAASTGGRARRAVLRGVVVEAGREAIDP